MEVTWGLEALCFGKAAIVRDREPTPARHSAWNRQFNSANFTAWNARLDCFAEGTLAALTRGLQLSISTLGGSAHSSASSGPTIAIVAARSAAGVESCYPRYLHFPSCTHLQQTQVSGTRVETEHMPNGTIPFQGAYLCS